MSKLHYSIDGDEVTIEVYEGERYSEKTSTVATQVFSLADVPSELKDGDKVKSMASYGLLKWLQDRTSQVKGAEDKLKAMSEEFETKAKAGLWKAPSERKASSGTGGSRRKISALLAEAVGALIGKTAIEAEAHLKALTKEQYEGLVANEKVVAKMDELKATIEADGDALADLL